MQVRDCFELDTMLEENVWVLRLFNVGPAYLNEETLLSREKGCVLAKITIFFFLAMSPNVKKDELEAAAQSTLNRTDTKHQKGL